MFQCQANVVEPFEERGSLVGRDCECADVTTGAPDLFGLKIDGERFAAVHGMYPGDQFVHVLVRESNGENSIFKAVLPKNIGMAARNDRTYAESSHGPGGVLARAAAPKVTAGNQYTRLPALRLLQHEVGIRAAVRAPAQIGEQPLGKVRVHAAEPGGGNDLIGIDV